MRSLLSMTLTVPLTLTAFAGLSGCKPTTISRAFDAGAPSTPADWSVRPRLTYRDGLRGELRLERTGNSALLEASRVTALKLKVNTVTERESEDSSITANRWITLPQDGPVTFNILMTTQGSGPCLASNATLNNRNVAVFCTTVAAPVTTVATAQEINTALRAACTQLQTQRIDPAREATFAGVEAASAETGCRCLNGANRVVNFIAFHNRSLADANAAFDVTCRRREPAAGQTLPLADLKFNRCVGLAGLARYKLNRPELVVAGLQGCTCGPAAGTTPPSGTANPNVLAYANTALADEQLFETECRINAGISAQQALPVVPAIGASTNAPLTPAPLTPVTATPVEQPLPVIKTP